MSYTQMDKKFELLRVPYMYIPIPQNLVNSGPRAALLNFTHLL